LNIIRRKKESNGIINWLVLVYFTVYFFILKLTYPVLNLHLNDRYLTLLADEHFLQNLDMQWKVFIKINNTTKVSCLLLWEAKKTLL